MSSALHKDIFGSDDDDDDDDAPVPQHAPEAGGDDDDDVDAILETHKNNLLLNPGGKKLKKGGGKEKEKKEPTGRGGKRKAAPDGETLRKRLKQRKDEGGTSAEGGGEGDAAGAEGGEGGEGGAAGDAGLGDDPDSDSVGGDEAIEEGGKKDGFEKIMQGLKHKRGGPNFQRDKLIEDVKDLQARMEEAVEHDDEASRAEPPRPALAKVAMVSEVETMLRKKQYHEIMIDSQMLSTLGRWLRPLPDGSLVNLQVRRALLTSLLRLEIDETTLGSLRSSGIGKYVKLLSLHKREQAENRRTAMSLIEKWSRPIFRTADKVQAQDLPVAARTIDLPAVQQPREEGEEMGSLNQQGGSQTANHARVPRPMGMDFQMLPASNVEQLPSQKYSKETTKGRLQERILNRKKKGNPQAVTLSVEGRTID